MIESEYFLHFSGKLGPARIPRGRDVKNLVMKQSPVVKNSQFSGSENAIYMYKDTLAFE